MKKIFVLAAFCLLASASQVSAQLTVKTNGNVEIGEDSYDPENPGIPELYTQWMDTVTVFKIFGRYGNNAEGAHMTFGDYYLYNTYYVSVGELGYTDSDRLWLHGKSGTYLTAGPNALDTVMYYDTHRGNIVKFNHDVHTSGVFVQSDERFKEDIEPVSEVLPSLYNLEAVSYRLKSNTTKSREGLAEMPVLNTKAQEDKEFFEQLYAEQEQGDERYGFLAQNVKEVFPQLVHTDKEGYMYVDYIGLIPILVQSINELSTKLETLENEKRDEGVAPTLRQTAQQTAQNEIEASLSSAKLYQNAPNPWSSETAIRYNLPQSVATASIYIYDMQGLQLKCIPAQGRGENQVTLTARDLKAGMYLYALVADGQLIDSKQMILTK